jgi:hypothetical protein
LSLTRAHEIALLRLAANRVQRLTSRSLKSSMLAAFVARKHLIIKQAQ